MTPKVRAALVKGGAIVLIHEPLVGCALIALALTAPNAESPNDR
ncbi:hypothetical protein SAMN05421809_3712 [Natronorubrum daqingense]|uniref:Uncharacterized protein n=1 Tax=Natronorubrum daqingense TaxID=588898 RepID=A0A1N7G4D1_9EURY|nr:hypothetical protein SAMN05421809_3712 [Natronorubrum daqingense]